MFPPQGLSAPWFWYRHPQASGSAAHQCKCWWVPHTFAHPHKQPHICPLRYAHKHTLLFSFEMMLLLSLLHRHFVPLRTAIANLCCMFFHLSSPQNGLNSSTARGKSSPTLTRCARRLRVRPIGSQGPTRAYLPSPSTYEFTLLMVWLQSVCFSFFYFYIKLVRVC